MRGAAAPKQSRAQDCFAGGSPLTAIFWLLVVAALVAAAGFAAVALARAGVSVTVNVDGRVEPVTTHRSHVAGLLADLGLQLRPEDRVQPAPETALQPGATVTVVTARPVLISADGALAEVYTHAARLDAVLAAAGLHLGPGDEVFVDGEPAAAGAALPAPAWLEPSGAFDRARGWTGRRQQPVRVAIRRAVPLVIDDGSVPYTIRTTAPTIGEALHREQITLYLGDSVQPALGKRVTAGSRVFIRRSTPVLVTADGRTTHTRTRGATVGATLMDLGVYVAGNDRVTPPLGQPVFANAHIRVARVAEVTLVEREAISYEAIMQPDDNLELDTQRLAQEGRDGEFRRRYKLVYEDSVEVSRTLLDEWVAQEPVNRIVAYGRKIVSRTLETPDGTFSYWRKIRMYATSYSPARAGTPKTAPWYGRTRIGLTLRKGIVAVDPKVIPLGKYVYVPGYGRAVAGDTGGGVKGKWIDMGYSDDDYISWHWWTDVYILDPPHPADKIMWVLPNYPPPNFPRRR